MLDVIEEVQRQAACPGGASECSPGPARAGALRAGLGQHRPIFLLSPRIARFWAVRGKRLGEGVIASEWEVSRFVVVRSFFGMKRDSRK